jgi:hypothetical protein
MIVFAAILLVATVARSCLRGSSSGRALAAYKASLRARGEKLTADELGFPRPPETNGGLSLLLASVKRIGRAKVDPGSLNLFHFVTPGRAQVSWAMVQPPLNVSRGGRTNATWEVLSEHFKLSSDALQGIRDAAQNPPRHFFNDPTNFFNQPKSPFVELRTAAQSLSGDAIVALRANDLGRAQADLHALTKLALFHHDDLTLVSQMIRTAIAGLGLGVTWEALQAPGWNEESLAVLQRDWESVDLIDAIEKGMTGERAFGEAAFSYMRSAGHAERMKMLRGSGTVPVRRSAEDYFEEFVLVPVWRVHADEDETFFLEYHQCSLDSIRKVRHGASWQAVEVELQSNIAQLNKAFSSPMGSIRHRFSAMAIPNTTRAAAVSVRHETQRRLTIAAIALERYRLREGHPPPDLDSLVPQLLSAVPIDPMSARPLGYRRNTGAGFTLYSAGEDGQDDAGDPNPQSTTNKLDLWAGKDAVWPSPAR